jgi:hypothetical protein
VLVFPAPTSPSHCVASGPGVLTATAGAPSRFQITPKDSFGNARPLDTSDLFTVYVARRPAGGRPPSWQSALVSDQHNGSYVAEYTVKGAGPYLVQVQLGGVHIMGSPFQSVVLAAATDARSSSASGVGLATCVAGSPSSFTIVARDAFDNPRTVCGDDFEVSLTRGDERARGASHVHGLVSEVGNGTYVVEYAVTSAGLYYVAINLGGRHISGSPYSMQAMPAEARAVHSRAFGAGLAHTSAGNLTEFYISAKDTYGNEEHASVAGNFSVRMAGPPGAGHVAATVTDGLNGLYTATYTPRRAGSYSVEVLYNRLPIFGSPYTTIVHPGRAAPKTTIVTCASKPVPPAGAHGPCAATRGVAGEVMRFDVRGRDTNANECQVGGEEVDAVIYPSSKASKVLANLGGGIKATVLDSGDGLYGVTYRVMASGEYELSVSLRGEPISGSPFALGLVPGATCAARSSVSGRGVRAATAGEDTLLKISAVDCYGNTQTAGGDPFTVVLTRPGVPSVHAQVLDRMDGTYDVSYNATIRGLWQMHVKAGGVHVAGSPFAVLARRRWCPCCCSSTAHESLSRVGSGAWCWRPPAQREFQLLHVRVRVCLGRWRGSEVKCSKLLLLCVMQIGEVHAVHK